MAKAELANGAQPEQFGKYGDIGSDRRRRIVMKGGQFFPSYAMPWWQELSGSMDVYSIATAIDVPYSPIIPSYFDRLTRLQNLEQKARNISPKDAELYRAQMNAIKDGATGSQVPEVRYDIRGDKDLYYSFLDGLFTPQEVGAFLHKSPDEIARLDVLDVACGTGAFLKSAFPVTPNLGRRVGVDISEGMLQRGIDNGNFTGMEPCQADAAKLPDDFKEGFDLSMMIFGLDRLSKPKVALSELARVTKNNGLVLLATPLPLEFASSSGAFIQPEDQIGEGRKALEDLYALIVELRRQNLQPLRWGVTTYYSRDIDSVYAWDAFVIVCKNGNAG